MEITNVTATAHSVEVDPLVAGDAHEMQFAFVEVETDAGITGVGEAGYYPPKTMATHVNEHLAPRVIGEDPFDTERIRDLCIHDDRVPTALQGAALSMLDIALWDIKGKARDEPIWRLLGGTDGEVDIYLTLGSPIDDPSTLASAAEEIIAEWTPNLKVVVGFADHVTPADDAQRIAAVREAIGQGPELAMDANGNYAIHQALDLSNRVAEHDLVWFEEPVHTNDRAGLINLRQRSPISVAAGQFSGHRSLHWELLNAGAIDLCQPNVCYVGGYTEGRKVAAMAEAANTQLAHAGGWPLQNMHLVGGCANGWRLEVHNVSWLIGQRIYEGIPKIDNGSIRLPETPGLGFTADRDALEASRID